uniref:39S ribosomal protein L32, mitochondrial n=1 Tax=Magallana gigas TaxID=29159 RepID=A0A8W8NJ68_MAGGI|nr:39S ribosomal protein L32, mitochondrial [Crassostrea gigas]
MSLLTRFQRVLQTLSNGFRLNVPALATANCLPEKSENGSHLTLQQCFENIMRAAVPKNRRSKEKRATRKMGHFKLFKKEHFKEKTEICLTCGNYYRRGFLCDHCYNVAKRKTMKIWKDIGDKYMNFQYFTVDGNPDNVRRSFKYEKVQDWFTDNENQTTASEQKDASAFDTTLTKEQVSNT